MYTVSAFLAQVRAIADTRPAYATGGTGKNGKCDCVGLIMGAMYGLGRKAYPMHSSNYFARYQTEELREIGSAADCWPGMIIYKARSSTAQLNARYQPGGRYYTGDMLDYYHVGVVLSVSPLRIVHCTSGGGADGIVTDTKLGQWSYGGRVAGLDGSGAENTEGADIMAAIYDARVTSANGKGANLRAKMSTSSERVDVLPEGALVQVLSVGGEWSRVAYNGLTGYVMSTFLSRVGSAEDAQEGGVAGYGVYLPCPTLEAAKALLTTLNGGVLKAGGGT